MNKSTTDGKYSFPFHRTLTSGITIFIFGLALFIIGIYFGDDMRTIYEITLLLSGAMNMAFGTSLQFYRLLKMDTMDMVNEDRKNNDASIQVLEEIEATDFLSKMITLHFTHLNKYYAEIRRQANKSFNVGIFIIVFGLVLIAISLIISIKVDSSIDYIAAISGAITEILGGGMLTIYYTSVKKMGQFFNKLLISQNIYTAMKISNELPLDMINDTRVGMINTLLSDINIHLVSDK